MKNLYVMTLAALAALSAFAGGNCEQRAAGLKSSQSVTLVPEYDPEEEDPELKYNEDSGVGYYKIRLSKGSACTIWIEGGNAVDMDLDVGTSMDDENAPWADFEMTEEFSNGNIKAAYLYADSWDMEEDPGSGTFYVCVSGDVGLTTTLKYVNGIQSFTQVGELDSPKSITFADSEKKTDSLNTVTDIGEYWFKAKFTKGRKYALWTTGGQIDSNLDISFEEEDGIHVEQDYSYTKTNDVRYFVIADETVTKKFNVMGEYGQSFRLYYKSIPVRAPSKHAFVELTSENSYQALIQPGRLNAGNDFYDQVADETLCRIFLNKGDRRVFETSNATGPIALAIYDSKGNVLAFNETMDGVGNDCRAVVKASADDYYYVGVYDPSLDVNSVSSMENVTLATYNADDIELADAFDREDDEYKTATKLIAVPGSADSDVVETAEAAGFASGPHAFNAGDWYDVYAIACRKGVTYRLRAAFADPETTSHMTLGFKLFYIADGKEKSVNVDDAVLMPFASDESELVFEASANRTYYLRVFVQEGLGLDFPEHVVCALAQKSGVELGVLRVKTKGAEGKWYVSPDKDYYSNGAAVNVVGSQKIVFAAVDGFSTATNQTVQVIPGATVTELVGVYNDSYDRYQVTKNKKKVWVTDDSVSGATAGAVAISATKGAVKTAKRTLWADDPVDNFRFTAAAGLYYNFNLEDTTLEGAGDAVFRILKDGEIVLGPTNTLSKHVFDPGDYILAVTHADEATKKDSSYELKYSTFNVGAVKFAASSYSVEENEEYVTLKVQRTASEGVVRVNWATLAGTNAVEALNAKPGEEYYPTNGIIAWAAGDMKDKTIKVRLLPDLVAMVESNKMFTVELWGMDPDDVADDEFAAVITRSSAKITLGEATKKAAGTVTAVAYGIDETPFSNTKKPTMTVKAGEPAEIVLRRSSYTAATKVAVKVTAVSDKKKYGDTAAAGTDFESFSTIVEWDDESDDDQPVSIGTLARDNDFTVSRQFTVTLSAVTTGAYKGWSKPSLTSSKVTVKIANDTAVQSFSSFAKAIKSNGVTASAKGTWVKDDDGSLVSKPSGSAGVTFTVNGPGLFVADPSIDGCGILKCKIGKGASFDVAGKIAKIVPSGKQDIVFSLTDAEGASAVSFAPFENGMPYKWVPFADVKPFSPVSKSMVNTNFNRIVWSVPEELEDEDVFFRVRFGTDKSPKNVLTNVTEDSSCEIPAGTLTAGKTWYWTLDFACPEGGSESLNDPALVKWTPGPTVWRFTTPSAKADVTVVDGVDSFGNDFSTTLDVDGEYRAETALRLMQGVKASFEVMGADADEVGLVEARLLAGALPSGLKLNAKKGTITGTPTKAGDYVAVLQIATGTAKKPVWATSVTLRITVMPIGTSVGTFRGVIKEDGSALELGAPKLGFVTFTVASSGKLTAKVSVAGKSYSYSATGFDEVYDYDDGAVGADKRLRATMTLTQKTTNGKTGSQKKTTGTYMNELLVELPDGASTNLSAIAETAGNLSLRMYVPNSKATAVTETDYVGTLYRANSGNAECKAMLKEFEGYYTVTFAHDAIPEDGVPAGHGYATLNVSDKGAVTLSGRLADGTSLSASSYGTLVGDYNGDATECVMYIPLYKGTSSYAFGGVAKIVWGEDEGYKVSILEASEPLVWYKDGASASADGVGFEMPLYPAGGWYNTIDNLQRYYLDYDFMLDGIGVTLFGNSVKLAAKTGDTVSSVTYSLNRTTGVASGTLTYNKVKELKHYGILTFYRDSTPLADDVWTAGFFMPKNSKWKESLPFDILYSEMDRDWTELEQPSESEK